LCCLFLSFFLFFTCFILFFFFYCSVDLRYLHSFPTRRSSDLFFLVGRAHLRDHVLCRIIGNDVVVLGDRMQDRHLDLRDVRRARSEEHTSELQSPYDLVCRLLLEKKKKQKKQQNILIQNTTQP